MGSACFTEMPQIILLLVNSFDNNKNHELCWKYFLEHLTSEVQIEKKMHGLMLS